MNVRFITLLFLVAGLSACYKDTQTCKCARQRKFDFKDACKNVEQMEPIPNVGAGIRWYTGVERFSPCYNPENEHEIAFCLVIHDNGPKTRVVIADLETQAHRLVKDIPWSQSSYPIEWGRQGGLLFTDKGQWMVFNTRSGDTMSVFPAFALSRPRWNAEGNRIVSWASEMYNEDDERLNGFEMASLSWPNFEIEPIPYFRSKQLPHHGKLAISPSGSYFYLQALKRTEDNVSESKWISKSFQDSGILFSSKPQIGYLGEDYEWHPNENDVYFANVDDGIFFISKGGSKQYRIKKGCPNRHYEMITISPLGDKLIAQRRDIEDDGSGGYVSENTKLVMMDIDGCNEEVLFEDWDGVILE